MVLLLVYLCDFGFVTTVFQERCMITPQKVTVYFFEFENLTVEQQKFTKHTTQHIFRTIRKTQLLRIESGQNDDFRYILEKMISCLIFIINFKFHDKSHDFFT